MPQMRMPHIQKQMPNMRQFLVGAYLLRYHIFPRNQGVAAPYAKIFIFS